MLRCFCSLSAAHRTGSAQDLTESGCAVRLWPGRACCSAAAAARLASQLRASMVLPEEVLLLVDVLLRRAQLQRSVWRSPSSVTEHSSRHSSKFARFAFQRHEAGSTRSG